MLYTIRSISPDGIYYLCNHWHRSNKMWVEESELKEDYLFKSPSGAIKSLKRLLEISDAYAEDEFEMIDLEDGKIVYSHPLFTSENLFTYACCGDIDSMKSFFNKSSRINIRYNKFNSDISLIMGAFRNNQFEMVDFLLKNGETLTEEERSAMETEAKRMLTTLKLANLRQERMVSYEQ